MYIKNTLLHNSCKNKQIQGQWISSGFVFPLVSALPASVSRLSIRCHVRKRGKQVQGQRDSTCASPEVHKRFHGITLMLRGHVSLPTSVTRAGEHHVLIFRQRSRTYQSEQGADTSETKTVEEEDLQR